LSSPHPQVDLSDRAWNDSGLGGAERVAALIEAMTLREKVAQLYGVWIGSESDGGEVAPHQNEMGQPVTLDELLRFGLGQLTRSFGTTPLDPAVGAAQLARTFLDDPVTSHIFRNEARREAALRAYFGTQMKADYLPFGGCYTAEGYAGSAIWAPAGKPICTPPAVAHGAQ